MAGLPAPRAIVCVSPPLFASAPRSGLATVIPVHVVSPNWRLFPPLISAPAANEQLPPLLLAMIVLATHVTGLTLSKKTAPVPVAVFPAIVQFLIVTGA